MAVAVEPFNKGLVTARDPMLLRPGELQRCNDCFYRPNDQAIWKAPGRTKFNTSVLSSSSTAIKGLRGLQFDDFGSNTSDDFLVAYETNNYWYATMPTATDPPTGSWISLVTGVGTGNTLDSVQYNNRYYLLNGNHDAIRNWVVKPSITSGTTPITRLHGLLPVVNVLDVAPASLKGWPDATAEFGDGYYFFFFTEVVNPNGADELESTVQWPATQFEFTSTPKHGVIFMSGTSTGVTVSLPDQDSVTAGIQYRPVNPNATHWRVYMHGPEQSPMWNNSMFLTSFRVAEIPFTIVSGLATVTSTTLGTNQLGQGFNLTTSATNISGWSNVANVQTDNSDSASSSTAGAAFLCKNFGFSGLTGTVWGIEVQVKVNADAAIYYLDIDVSYDNGANFTPAVNSTPVFPSSPVAIFTVGSPTNNWGRTWTLAELNDGAFAVRATLRPIAGVSTLGIKGYVNFVKAKVNYGTSAPVSKAGAMFPYVAIQVGPLVTVEGANGPPPIASTGDIFEGQLVINNVDDPSRIHYSLPDKVDYFPFSYFINFETKEADVITHIRTLGDKLVVGAAHQIYRVNYLPRSEDAEFDRGRCYEVIAADHGIIGTQAACLFSPPEKNDASDGQLLAYASVNGLHATNGFSSTTLTEDLDWSGMVNLAKLSTSIMVNYPKYYELVFYYIPADDLTSSYPTRALHLSYHPSHIKEGGKLLVSGPCVVTAASAYSGKYLNKPIHYSGRTDGTVYVEDQAFTDAAGVGINPDIVTRDIYAAGIGYEHTIERVWVRHYQHTPASTVLFTPYWRNTEGEFVHPSAAGTPWTQDSFTTTKGAPLTGSIANLKNGGSLSRMYPHHKAESFVYRYQQNDGSTGMALSMMGIEFEGHGLEDTYSA